MMALCDQWWNPDKTGLNRSRYLLLPLLFDSKTGTGRLVCSDSRNPLAVLKIRSLLAVRIEPQMECTRRILLVC